MYDLQGLPCLLTESLDTTVYINGEHGPGDTLRMRKKIYALFRLTRFEWWRCNEGSLSMNVMMFPFMIAMVSLRVRYYATVLCVFTPQFNEYGVCGIYLCTARGRGRRVL